MLLTFALFALGLIAILTVLALLARLRAERPSRRRRDGRTINALEVLAKQPHEFAHPRRPLFTIAQYLEALLDGARGSKGRAADGEVHGARGEHTEGELRDLRSPSGRKHHRPRRAVALRRLGGGGGSARGGRGTGGGGGGGGGFGGRTLPGEAHEVMHILLEAHLEQSISLVEHEQPYAPEPARGGAHHLIGTRSRWLRAGNATCPFRVDGGREQARAARRG